MISLSRKERDRLLRKNDILRAAAFVFARKGFYRATIQDIAKAAQYAAGTVYLYFKDKDALYFSLLEEKLRDLLALLKDKTADIKDAKGRLSVFLETQLAFFDSNQDFFKIFCSESENEISSLDHKISDSPVSKAYLSYSSTIFKMAQEQGVIRKDLDCYQMAVVFMSILKSVITGWLKDKKEEQKKLDNVSRLILDVFLSGAGAK